MKIKPIYTCLLLLPLLFSGFVLSAQAGGHEIPHKYEKPIFTQPVRIPLLTEEKLTPDFYKDQETAWLKTLQKNPENSEYWLHAYRAVRFGEAVKNESPVTITRQPLLDSILEAMKPNCAASFAFNYLTYVNGKNNPALFPFLETAYALEPERKELIREFVFYYTLKADSENQKIWLKRWEAQFANDSSLSLYAHNLLSSLETGAVLIAGSETDAFPILAEQRLRNFRTDVLVIPLAAFANGSTLQHFMYAQQLNVPEHYLATANDAAHCAALAGVNPQRPFYFAASVEKNILRAMQKNLYLTGLAFRYSEVPFDNMPQLTRNITEDYRWYSGKTQTRYWIRQLEMNYVLPLLLGAKEERKTKNTNKAAALEAKALEIATRAGKQNDVKKYLAQGGG